MFSAERVQREPWVGIVLVPFGGSTIGAMCREFSDLHARCGEKAGAAK